MTFVSNRNETNYTFLGLDFGLARMIGSHGFNNPSAIRDRLFSSWNLVLLKEKRKYDVKKFMGLKNYQILIDWNTNRNLSVPVDGLVINGSYSLSETDVLDYIASLPELPIKGMGITFVVESFNKIEESAYIWIVVFEIETKKVISIARKNGRPSGLGIRNYWANAVCRVIKSLDKQL